MAGCCIVSPVPEPDSISPLTIAESRVNAAVWDRLPGETDAPWRYFQRFRDLPPDDRTIRGFASMMGVSEALLNKFKSKFKWRERVAAFDAHINNLQVERSMVARLEMHKRHAAAGRSMLRVADRRISRLLPEELEVADAVKLAKVGVEIERLARGESEAGPGVSVAINAPSSAIAISWGSNQPAWLPNAKSPAASQRCDLESTSTTHEAGTRRGNAHTGASSRIKTGKLLNSVNAMINSSAKQGTKRSAKRKAGRLVN